MFELLLNGPVGIGLVVLDAGFLPRIDGRLAIREIHVKPVEIVVRLRPPQNPVRDFLHDLLVRQGVRVDSVLRQRFEEIATHARVPVGRNSGFEVVRHPPGILPPIRVRRDRLLSRAQRIVDDLQLDVSLGFLAEARVLIVVADRGLVDRGHDAQDGSNRVRIFAAFVPVAVRRAVAVAVALGGVRSVLVNLLEVGKPVAVGVQVFSGWRAKRQGAAQQRRRELAWQENRRKYTHHTLPFLNRYRKPLTKRAGIVVASCQELMP